LILLFLKIQNSRRCIELRVSISDPNIRPIIGQNSTVSEAPRGTDTPVIGTNRSANTSNNNIPNRVHTEQRVPGSRQDRASGEQQPAVIGQQPTLDREAIENQVIRAIETANNSHVSRFTRLEFSIHETTRQIMVKVYDRTTDEVIREIPPERVLDFVAFLWEAAGIIVDNRA
jgi:flagellar protein FlaG